AMSDMFQDLDDVLTVVRRLQDGNMPADDLGGGVAEDPLSATVPACDDTIEGLGDHGVVGRFDDGGEHLPQFLGPLPLGVDVGDHAVAWRGLADFLLGVPLVARLNAHRVVPRLRESSWTARHPSGRLASRPLAMGIVQL